MPSHTEQLAELALRYQGANAASDEGEEARLRLLIADCEPITPENLRLAIRDGVKVWKFMPTAAEIFEAAKEYVAWSKPTPTYDTPALPDQTQRKLSDHTDTDALLRETFAKLNAGHAKLTGGSIRESTPRTIYSGPPRMPTAAELAEIAAQPTNLTGGASPALKAMLGLNTTTPEA